MDAMQMSSLVKHGLVVPDASGKDAVRVYLQYLPNVSGRSAAARGRALRDRFERVARKHADVGVQLDPKSMSVSGQMIEALLPLEHYEQARHQLEDEKVRVDIVESYDATL